MNGSSNTSPSPALLLAVIAGLAYGSAVFIGYSGAPTARGSCAASCHGSSGGTILVSGFPARYDTGATYLIHVTHSGGAVISNFNASVRTDRSGAVTGTINAGFNTETYEQELESSGVHLAVENQDSATFTWTAPGPYTGDVTLYLAGLQGDMDGPNTEIAINAAPNAIEETKALPADGLELVLESRLIADYLALRFSLPASVPARLTVLSPAGRTVARLKPLRAEGRQWLVWTPVDEQGRRLAPGSYFISLVAGNQRLIRRFTIAH